MIKFSKKIVQFGFGAVGKSFFEKVSKEIDFVDNNYFVITRDKYEFKDFINLGGIASNFYVLDINKDNYDSIFSGFLSEGDLLIDFADSVGTRDICEWCCKNKIMYLNTGETDWPENWYSILEENLKKQKLKKELSISYPIVLQHGNNPGLVSHFVKAALEYIVIKQFKNNKEYKRLLKENKFNILANKLGLKMIHVNDIDLQEINEEFNDQKLFSTWCVDSFFFELLSEATQNVGTHEVINKSYCYNLYDKENGFIEYKNLACDKECKTYYPGGNFNGYLVPHEETITIANSLEIKDKDNILYRPSVMFIYSPCKLAREYLEKSKVNDYPNPDPGKPQDIECEDGVSIVRGHICPSDSAIAYKEVIKNGTEYVGVLLLGDNFSPVWVGNRVEMNYLYNKKKSYWQTPTITPVAMSALAAVTWMIKNQDKGGIYFPDEIDDYKYIIKTAEKYISKTIYKTLTKKEIEKTLNIKLDNIKSNDFFV